MLVLSRLLVLAFFSLCVGSSAANSEFFHPTMFESWSNNGRSVTLDPQSGLKARFIFTVPRFAFGFYRDAETKYILAIYMNPFKDSMRRRIWHAKNEDGEAITVKQNARLNLEAEGKLTLVNGKQGIVWSTDSENGVKLNLEENGNLVLYDAQGSAIWESFTQPLQTLLPGQKLQTGMKLRNGPHSLVQENEALVLYTNNLQIWRYQTISGGLSSYVVLSRQGLHMHQEEASGMSDEISPELGGRAKKNPPHPIKTWADHQALALSLTKDGSIQMDMECSKDSQRLTSSSHHPPPPSPPFIFCCLHSGPDQPKPEDVKKVPRLTSQTQMKPKGRTLKSLIGSFQMPPSKPPMAETEPVHNSKSSLSRKRKAGIIIAGFFGIVSISIIGVFCKKKTQSRKTLEEIREALPEYQPEHFSFRRLREITNNFSKSLGDGGFGFVYEGILKDGSKVAVKLLEKTSAQGEKEFKAEITTMARVRHMNIVPLKGYCIDGTRRVIVYEFMANGSLDRWLFNLETKDTLLDWAKRFGIALGTARGLAYLHEECSEKILHLDVKPENILLDENFSPKVSDFGLAKLLQKKQSKVVTNMRGTPGYLAPEWLHGSPVTSKTDVYSFGMVLLELLCGRETIDLSKGSEQWYLPAWAVRMVEEGRSLDIIDQNLQEEVEYFYEDQARRAIKVALSCIQENPTQRPLMSRVVQMLEGSIEPKFPQLCRLPMQPAAPKMEKFQAFADRQDQAAVVAAAAELLIEAQILDKNQPSWGLLGGNEVGTIAGANRTVIKARNATCIPPWPLKGDVVLVRGSGVGGEFIHAVIRDVKVRTQQIRLALLHKLDSERTWGVLEEETLWRQWSVLVRTLEFWIPVKWSTVPGGGPQKFPTEWLAN